MGQRAVRNGQRDTDLTGAELRAIRTACGFNLADFGREIGVADKSVRGWEKSNDMRVPVDVADEARALYTELMTVRQDILDAYVDVEPGGEVTLVLYRIGDYDGSFAEATLYNAAVVLAYHALVDDGVGVWVEWSS